MLHSGSWLRGKNLFPSSISKTRYLIDRFCRISGNDDVRSRTS
jgi:phage baseplate assembly protein gpV